MPKIKVIVAEGKTYWYFHCQPCDQKHGVNDSWTLSGTPESPTISPSVLCRMRDYDENQGVTERICHLFVRDGKIQYCDDSWHDLRGQIVDMKEEDGE